MDLLWCTKYESCKKNYLGQPHVQREAHPLGGHHEWHVYARLPICHVFVSMHCCTISQGIM